MIPIYFRGVGKTRNPCVLSLNFLAAGGKRPWGAREAPCNSLPGGDRRTPLIRVKIVKKITKSGQENIPPNEN